MATYTYADNVFSFEGAASVQVENDFVAPWRVDHSHIDFYPFLRDRVARVCSGVRLCFSTDSKQISLGLAEVPEKLRLDLFVDGQLTEELSLEPGTTNAAFNALSGEWKRIEIFLDQGQPFNLRNVEVDDGAAIKKTLVTQKRWITYGSSITHAGSAKRPSQIWPTLVAQKLNLHLTTFGFGGNCQSEPMMGRIIRDMPADFITLKLGINSVGGALSARTFGSNVIGLIQIIREKHPETPMALISPIYSPPRESEKGGSGLSLQDMREIHEGIAASCLKYGDRNLYYVDGLKVFGPAELKYLPDELHPDAEGQFVMAENFAREVFGRFPS